MGSKQSIELGKDEGSKQSIESGKDTGFKAEQRGFQGLEQRGNRVPSIKAVWDFSYAANTCEF